MRYKLGGILLMVSILATSSAVRVQSQPAAGGKVIVHEGAHVRVTEEPTDLTSLVVELTLEQFWKLASLQLRDPAAANRLLESDPRHPATALGPLKVGFEAYRRQLGQVAQVRPRILFLKHGADPEEEARRRGLAISPWLRQTPPAFLSGPLVDVLILFAGENSAGGDRPWGRPAARVQIASAAVWSRLWLAEAPPEPIGLRRYQVQPKDWRKGVVFEHTRCMVRSPDVKLVTKLFYEGGITDSHTTPLTDADWKECGLSTDPHLRAATVRQPGRPAARRPLIIAGSYFLAPEPGPFLSDWIAVK